MMLTALDLKTNLYAFWLAAATGLTPEQAFEYLTEPQITKPGEKYCTGCGLSKPLKDFYKRSYLYKGQLKERYVQPCKECLKKKEREKYRKKKAGTE